MGIKFWANIALCCLLIAAISKGVQTFSRSSVAEVLRPVDHLSDETKELLKEVDLVRYGVRMKKGKNQVDGIFSFENRSEQKIGKVTISCKMIDKNGRFLGRQKWLLGQPIDMLSKQTIVSQNNRMFIPRRAEKIECVIVDLSNVEKPLIAVHRSHGESGSHDGHQKSSSTSTH